MLTARGRTLLAVGSGTVGLGWYIGETSVIAIGALLLLVPALALVAVRRARFALGSARTVERTRVAVGTDTEVVLTVENASRLASGVLLLQDEVTDNLSEAPVVLLDRVPPRAQRAERYRVVGLERGRARIGPLSVTITDPFGASEITRSFSTTTPLLVTPAIVPLGPTSASLSPGGRGEAQLRSLAARGDDDVLPREHRPGDDMRRIHWRATARSGELMVRREEQAWRSSMAIQLDTRASAHEGIGSASSFEWAVSATASIAVEYLRQGWRVSVVTLGGRVLADGQLSATMTDDPILEALSEVRMDLEPVRPGAGLDVEGSSAVIAILGRTTDEVSRALIRPRSGFAGCLPLAPAPAEHFRSLGWRVVPWTRGTPVGQAWDELTTAPVGAGR